MPITTVKGVHRGGRRDTRCRNAGRTDLSKPVSASVTASHGKRTLQTSGFLQLNQSCDERFSPRTRLRSSKAFKAACEAEYPATAKHGEERRYMASILTFRTYQKRRRRNPCRPRAVEGSQVVCCHVTLHVTTRKLPEQQVVPLLGHCSDL